MESLTMRVTRMHEARDQLTIHGVQLVVPTVTTSLSTRECMAVFSPGAWQDMFTVLRESGAPILNLPHRYICGKHSSGAREPRCNICGHLLSLSANVIRSLCPWPTWYPLIKPVKHLVTMAGLTVHALTTNKYFFYSSKEDALSHKSAVHGSTAYIGLNGSIHGMENGLMPAMAK